MRRLVRDNSLSLVLVMLFLLFVVPQSLTGHREYNQDQREHNQPTVRYVEYLGEGHFSESVFENWESEFLQIFGYVLLTAYFRQKGSPESKKVEGEEAVDADPSSQAGPSSPWAARRGGGWARLYSHSLSLVFAVLFLASMALHAVGGAKDYSDEQQLHGEARVTTTQYVTTARFWFESFQNWQSEFLAVGTLVVLGIFLRERHSPESKPVAAPHGETGRK